MRTNNIQNEWKGEFLKQNNKIKIQLKLFIDFNTLNKKFGKVMTNFYYKIFTEKTK